MGEIAKPKPDADFLCFCIFRLRRLCARFRPQIPSPLDVLCQVVHFTTQAGSHLSKHVGGTHCVGHPGTHTLCGTRNSWHFHPSPLSSCHNTHPVPFYLWRWSANMIGRSFHKDILSNCIFASLRM